MRLNPVKGRGTGGAAPGEDPENPAVTPEHRRAGLLQSTSLTQGLIYLRSIQVITKPR